ncbi:MAG: glycosyl transferase group 1 [Frankiales bacterium]|nr:glycosyl transferase group 1 [Frankiales bacterium]
MVQALPVARTRTSLEPAPSALVLGQGASLRPTTSPLSPSRRRTVCLYTPSFDPSGMGGHMVDLAAAYAPEVDVTVMAWPTSSGRRLLAAASAVGARPVAIPHPRDPAFAHTVEEVLRSLSVEVFHAHVGTGREDFDGARAARRAGVGAVVQTLHLPWLMGSPKHRTPLFRSLREVDRLIAVSEGQRRTYERAGVPSELITTVVNGIRPRRSAESRQQARLRLGVRGDQRLVLAVGRLLVQKGHRYLVEAVPELVARFPDAVVVVVGEGALRAELEARASSLGVSEQLRLVGFVDDARSLLSAADVFVLPSRQEALPLSALEAMDAGLPVVGTDVLGTAEVVEDGVTGLLVRPEDPAALAGAITALLADPQRARQYGSAGRSRFHERYTSERMARQTLAVYEQALATQPGFDVAA